MRGMSDLQVTCEKMPTCEYELAAARRSNRVRKLQAAAANSAGARRLAPLAITPHGEFVTSKSVTHRQPVTRQPIAMVRCDASFCLRYRTKMSVCDCP